MAAVSPVIVPAGLVGAADFYAENRINPLLVQERVGQIGQSFKMIKLRTMPFNFDHKDRSNGHNDERASPVGKVLRGTAIDEVPQALHILSGRMSVVGPRPLLDSDIQLGLDLLSPSERRDWEYARAVPRPGWVSRGANLGRTMVHQSEDYLLARVEADITYMDEASFVYDWGLIKEAVGIGVETVGSVEAQQ